MIIAMWKPIIRKNIIIFYEQSDVIKHGYIMVCKCDICNEIFYKKWNNKDNINKILICKKCQENKRVELYYNLFKESVEKENYIMISEIDDYKNAKTLLEMLCPENHSLKMNWNNWKTGKRCFTCSNGYKTVNGKRRCTECENWLPLLEYHKGKRICKNCRLEYQRSEEGKKSQYQRSKNWSNSEKGKKFYKKRHISHTISCGIRNSLKDGKNNHHWEDLVDFTLEDFKKYIESLFTEGMTWENHGKWHIDHIRPISSFNIENYECDDFHKCWSLNNLQPLWAQDNLRKNDKWDGIINK